jgi:DMSO/TMAO reductase YedYZ molybdopterin-dependent catalytic subunit
VQRRAFIRIALAAGMVGYASGVSAQTAEDQFPPPPSPRQLPRDRDGSLLGSRREPGSLAEPITGNDQFYVVTKNAVADPVLDARTWRMVIDGAVASPVQLDYRVLRALEPTDITKTLECISNFTSQCEQASFGCELIGTAHWRGVRLSEVLDLAGGLTADAVGLAVVSADEFSAGLPLDVAADPDTLLVYEMNGQVLPREHGYPARLLVPGRYGMKSPKWVVGVSGVRQEHVGWYEQRNWNREGVVQTMARIDAPANGAVLGPGVQPVAGIAYAGLRGVAQVEYSSDGGVSWVAAEVEPPLGRDTWVRWHGAFELATGTTATLIVRATDGTGEVQTEFFQLPQPNGATGRHTVQVQAVS